MSSENRRVFLKRVGFAGLGGFTDFDGSRLLGFGSASTNEPDQTVLITDDIHHLGDGAFSGQVNSNFRESVEGTSYSTRFELDEAQIDPDRAELVYHIRGTERRNRLYINGSQVATTGNSPAFDVEERTSVAPNLLSKGNRFSVEAKSGTYDYDDFEISNVTLALYGVNEPPNPSVAFTPDDPSMGEEVTLDATESTDPDGSIEEYRWDLDSDGDIDTRGAKVTHEFSQSPEASVTLQVIDDEGTAASETVSIPVDFRFTNRSAKMTTAETLHDRSVLSTIESLTDSDIDGDPEMATATMDVLEEAVNDRRITQHAAEGALRRHLVAERAATDIIERIGPGGDVTTNLARTTAEFVVRTAVDLLLMALAIKLVAAGHAGYIVTALLDGVDQLFSWITSRSQDTDAKPEMKKQCRSEANDILQDLQSGALSAAEDIARAVNTAAEALVDTFEPVFQAFVELEQINAILNRTTAALPQYPELPSTSLYGSLGRLDESLQPENLRGGLPGSTSAAVSSIEDARPRLNGAIEGIVQDMEEFGEFADGVDLYETLDEWVNDDLDVWEITLSASSLIYHGVVGTVLDSISALSGALSFVIIKETYDEMVQAAIEGREVDFSHV